jgi:hypothetical protein
LPKQKPDQVIIHRIEFQESERELLSQVATAYSINNVSKGVFNLTSDMTTVVCLIVLYEMLTDKDTGILDTLGNLGIDDLAAGLAQSWNNYRNSQEYSEEYHERATSVAGGLRNMLDNFIGFFTGEYFERLEEARAANEAK